MANHEKKKSTASIKSGIGNNYPAKKNEGLKLYKSMSGLLLGS
jgi:hypothetical protein